MSLDEVNNIINKEIGVMLYFSGESCSVCHALRPKIKTLFNEKFPKIIQIHFDAKESIDVASHFGVLSIPTILVFLDGKESVREGRSVSLNQLEDKIMRLYEMMLS